MKITPTMILCGLLALGILAVAALWIMNNAANGSMNKGTAAAEPARQAAAGLAHPSSARQEPPGQTAAAQNGSRQGGNNYSIGQAISDKAQLDTIAFSGLGFLTGDLCSDSFLPPGKVADYFGFQYQRDVTQSGKGHSTDFVTNCANNVLYILNGQQKAQLYDLARDQASSVSEYAVDRYPLMMAFRRQLAGDLPAGSPGLSAAAVADYSANLYELDANISLRRAELYAGIIRSLNASQKQYLDSMIAGGFAAWPELPDQVDKKSVPHDEDVLVMTYAGDIYSWYAGDVESDTYFCPERQADYFGGFYIKDAPAIGHAGYTIAESITGDSGEAFLANLSNAQRPLITGLVASDKSAISGIVEQRRALATELRKALAGGTIDEAKVRALAREYGRLDGEISCRCAVAFSAVGQSLTSNQKASLLAIRNLANYPTQNGTIYLYSDKIDLPGIRNTDFLFG